MAMTPRQRNEHLAQRYAKHTPIRLGDIVILAHGPSPEMLVVDAEPGSKAITAGYKHPNGMVKEWELPRDQFKLVRRARHG